MLRVLEGQIENTHIDGSVVGRPNRLVLVGLAAQALKEFDYFRGASLQCSRDAGLASTLLRILSKSYVLLGGLLVQ